MPSIPHCNWLLVELLGITTPGVTPHSAFLYVVHQAHSIRSFTDLTGILGTWLLSEHWISEGDLVRMWRTLHTGQLQIHLTRSYKNHDSQHHQFLWVALKLLLELLGCARHHLYAHFIHINNKLYPSHPKKEKKRKKEETVPSYTFEFFKHRVDSWQCSQLVLEKRFVFVSKSILFVQ